MEKEKLTTSDVSKINNPADLNPNDTGILEEQIILNDNRNIETLVINPNPIITPGTTSFCQMDIEEEAFEFLHPKTTCTLKDCTHFFICQQWEKEQQKRASRAPAGAILTIPQTVANSPSSYSSVYSQIDFPSKGQNLKELNEILDQNQKEQPQNENTPADYPVVGSGQPHAKCGTYWTKVCLEEHPAKQLNDIIDYQRDLDGKCMHNGAYIQRVMMSCHRPICPVCWTNWRRRQVAKVQKRFDTDEKTFTPWEKRNFKRCHLGVAIPKSMHHLTKKEMQQKVVLSLKRVGINGGSLVYHSKRQHERIRGNWTSENTYFWPHFHVYTHLKRAWIDGAKVDENSKDTGIIIRNFGERPLAKSISYQLSHAGVPSNHAHIVTWFGSMNYRKLHVEKYQGTDATCPWGHKFDHYGVYAGKETEKPPLPDKHGYNAIVKKDGWLYLPKKRKKELDDPGGGYYDDYE